MDPFDEPNNLELVDIPPRGTDAESESNEYYEKERTDFDRGAREQRLEQELLTVRQAKWEIAARKIFANRTLWQSLYWLTVVLGCVLADAWNCYGFDLSDRVMMVLIGITILNVLGLFLTVMKYLFTRPAATHSGPGK